MTFCRFQKKRLVLSVGCIFFLYFLLYLGNIFHSQPSSCTTNPDLHKNISNVIEKLLYVLDSLNISYFLCYESLWGALKAEGPLPWQKDFDLCVLNQDVSRIDEAFLYRTFKRAFLDVTYNIPNGFYAVSLHGQKGSSAFIYIFDKDTVTHQMRRVGLTNRVLPPNACDILHCFPPDLILPPLPHLKFMKFEIPAPREEIEIQKYLYPNSWWKELKPDYCL